MARHYGIVNKYDSQLHRCAISGLRFYRSEMVKVAEDRYVYHKYLDEDYRRKARGKTAGIEGDTYATDACKGLIMARAYGTPLAAHHPGNSDYVCMYVGGD